nr:uncharacterized protein LOC114823016 [Malus domestica]
MVERPVKEEKEHKTEPLLDFPPTRSAPGVDKIGGENPTWNDRFLFKVPSAFLSRETSHVSIQIYAVGCFSDHLVVGTVRLLINNFLDVASKVPSAASARPSGRFQGVLNVAAMVIDGSYLAPAVSELSAVGYRDAT